MSTQRNLTDDSDKDGGYYAVKGFLYQFDMTIKTILNNPLEEIMFEQVQDISYEDYIIQVKHKESQTYSPSKVRKPIIQLLELYKLNNNKKYRLHCYFKSIITHKKQLSKDELDEILSDKKMQYTSRLKEGFIKNFELYYTEDFISQFDEVIELIKSNYDLKDRESAIVHHAMIRSHLLQLAINTDRLKRTISKSHLDDYVKEAHKLFFDLGYSNYLGRDKYEKHLKKKYFTVGINLLNLQRLFIIDFMEEDNDASIFAVMEKIINKYNRNGKSPAPIFCFKNLSRERVNLLKRALFDNEIGFCDGTFFDGDKFRLNRFTEHNSKWKFKIIQAENLDFLLESNYLNQIFHFYLTDYSDIFLKQGQYIHIHIEEVSQIVNIIK